MDVILIRKEDAPAFSGVLPEEFMTHGDTVALGAVDEGGTVTGAIALQKLPDEYKILWLYVEKGCRRKGIGTALIREADVIVKKLGAADVTCSFPLMDEQMSLLSFFRAITGPELPVDISFSFMRCKVKALEFYRSKLLGTGRPEGQKPVRLLDLSEKYIRNILERVEDQYTVTDFEAWREDCVKELCLVMMTKTGDPAALMIVRSQKKGLLKLEYLRIEPGQVRALMTLLCEAADMVEKNYPDCEITFDALTEESASLSEKFFPDASRVPVYTAEW